MKFFSQRMGLSAVRTTIQTNDLDRPTRNALWNVISSFFRKYAQHCTVYTDIWTELYNETADTHPRMPEYHENVNEHFYFFYKKRITTEKWYECLDLIEFLNREDYCAKWNEQLGYLGDPACRVPTASEYNQVLVKFLVGYRIVHGQVVPITNDDEFTAIDEAIQKAPDSVAEQMDKALRFLGDRKKPDYAKSVQCSISAVEAQCKVLANDDTLTLGQALKALENKGIVMHGALKAGLEKIYGFTSDAAGIRHAGINPSDVDFDLAKFMLVACSAFVNYLRSKEN